MRQLDQPVMLNDAPPPPQQTAAGYELSRVDEYYARVWAGSLMKLGRTNEFGPAPIGDEAQVNAFLKIGGQSNLVIHAVRLDAMFQGALWVCCGDELVAIRARGEVSELLPAGMTNVPSR